MQQHHCQQLSQTSAVNRRHPHNTHNSHHLYSDSYPPDLADYLEYTNNPNFNNTNTVENTGKGKYIFPAQADSLPGGKGGKYIEANAERTSARELQGREIKRRTPQEERLWQALEAGIRGRGEMPPGLLPGYNGPTFPGGFPPPGALAAANPGDLPAINHSLAIRIQVLSEKSF